MPEMTFTVRWPDGTVDDCYSPSLVMHDHLTAGTGYPLSDFVERTTVALDAASARVRERYGFECTSAQAQLADIQETSARFAPDDAVLVIAMNPALPAVTP